MQCYNYKGQISRCFTRLQNVLWSLMKEQYIDDCHINDTITKSKQQQCPKLHVSKYFVYVWYIIKHMYCYWVKCWQ